MLRYSLPAPMMRTRPKKFVAPKPPLSSSAPPPSPPEGQRQEPEGPAVDLKTPERVASRESLSSLPTTPSTSSTLTTEGDDVKKTTQALRVLAIDKEDSIALTSGINKPVDPVIAPPHERSLPKPSRHNRKKKKSSKRTVSSLRTTPNKGTTSLLPIPETEEGSSVEAAPSLADHKPGPGQPSPLVNQRNGVAGSPTSTITPSVSHDGSESLNLRVHLFDDKVAKSHSLPSPEILFQNASRSFKSARSTRSGRSGRSSRWGDSSRRSRAHAARSFSMSLCTDCTPITDYTDEDDFSAFTFLTEPSLQTESSMYDAFDKLDAEDDDDLFPSCKSLSWFSCA